MFAVNILQLAMMVFPTRQRHIQADPRECALWLTAFYYKIVTKKVLMIFFLKNESEAYLWNGPASLSI